MLHDFVERTREGHRLSDQNRNCFTGDVGETSERRVGHINYGLFRAHSYHLELN